MHRFVSFQVAVPKEVIVTERQLAMLLTVFLPMRQSVLVSSYDEYKRAEESIIDESGCKSVSQSRVFARVLLDNPDGNPIKTANGEIGLDLVLEWAEREMKNRGCHTLGSLIKELRKECAHDYED